MLKLIRNCSQCGKPHEERFPDMKSAASYNPEGLVIKQGSGEFYFCCDECAIEWLKGEKHSKPTVTDKHGREIKVGSHVMVPPCGDKTVDDVLGICTVDNVYPEGFASSDPAIRIGKYVVIASVCRLLEPEPKPQPIGKDIVAKLAELTPTKLEYSEYTNCFYVHTNAEIGGDSFLCGITEHRATKEEAYEAFAQRITNLPQGKHLVIDAMKDSRKHYTWNGSEFVQIDEVTRKDVTP
jgi:hypothetical protein